MHVPRPCLMPENIVSNIVPKRRNMIYPTLLEYFLVTEIKKVVTIRADTSIIAYGSFVNLAIIFSYTR